MARNRNQTQIKQSTKQLAENIIRSLRKSITDKDTPSFAKKGRLRKARDLVTTLLESHKINGVSLANSIASTSPDYRQNIQELIVNELLKNVVENNSIIKGGTATKPKTTINLTAFKANVETTLSSPQVKAQIKKNLAFSKCVNLSTTPNNDQVVNAHIGMLSPKERIEFQDVLLKKCTGPHSSGAEKSVLRKLNAYSPELQKNFVESLTKSISKEIYSDKPHSDKRDAIIKLRSIDNSPTITNKIRPELLTSLVDSYYSTYFKYGFSMADPKEFMHSIEKNIASQSNIVNFFKCYDATRIEFYDVLVKRFQKDITLNSESDPIEDLDDNIYTKMSIDKRGKTPIIVINTKNTNDAGVTVTSQQKLPIISPNYAMGDEVIKHGNIAQIEGYIGLMDEDRDQPLINEHNGRIRNILRTTERFRATRQDTSQSLYTALTANIADRATVFTTALADMSTTRAQKTLSRIKLPGSKNLVDNFREMLVQSPDLIDRDLWDAIKFSPALCAEYRSVKTTRIFSQALIENNVDVIQDSLRRNPSLANDDAIVGTILSECSKEMAETILQKTLPLETFIATGLNPRIYRHYPSLKEQIQTSPWLASNKDAEREIFNRLGEKQGNVFYNAVNDAVTSLRIDALAQDDYQEFKKYRNQLPSLSHTFKKALVNAVRNNVKLESDPAILNLISQEPQLLQPSVVDHVIKNTKGQSEQAMKGLYKLLKEYNIRPSVAEQISGTERAMERLLEHAAASKNYLLVLNAASQLPDSDLASKWQKRLEQPHRKPQPQQPPYRGQSHRDRYHHSQQQSSQRGIELK